MEDWNQFKTNKTVFIHKWLLKKKRKRGTDKDLHVKPYLVPIENGGFNKYFEYFLENFNYPNYLFRELVMSSHLFVSVV